ncbi:MAG: hypothetical protein ACLQU4_21995 [Limisphaerales bacterium]
MIDEASTPPPAPNLPPDDADEPSLKDVQAEGVGNPQRGNTQRRVKLA